MGPRDILEEVSEGKITVEEAEARLTGYVTTDAGRFDAARERRRGLPEAVFAPGKTTAEIVALVEAALETTGRAIVTRIDETAVTAVRESIDADLVYDERSSVLVVQALDFEPPALDARVGIVTGGTADAVPAGEAAAIVRETGATVERIEDVGVANLTRIVDQLPVLREQDVLIVAAGREGALPTVVAGLVDVPVIGLPVSSGYGHAGDGEAALSGMLQSCTVLSVVNIDAGFVAGAQAGLIAEAIATARGD